MVRFASGQECRGGQAQKGAKLRTEQESRCQNMRCSLACDDAGRLAAHPHELHHAGVPQAGQQRRLLQGLADEGGGRQAAGCKANLQKGGTAAPHVILTEQTTPAPSSLGGLPGQQGRCSCCATTLSTLCLCSASALPPA